MRSRSVVFVGIALFFVLFLAGQASAEPLYGDFVENGDIVNAYGNNSLTASGTETAQLKVPFVTALSGFGFKFYRDMQSWISSFPFRQASEPHFFG
jgi:hypothetical protein